MTGSFPRWCAPDCEHASFPDEKALDGACHTFIALYCARYGRLVNKSALCLDAQAGRREDDGEEAGDGLSGSQDDRDPARIGDILRTVLESGRQAAYEHEAYEILRLAGIETPVTRFFGDISAISRFDADTFPGDEVICKIISPEMPHRSEHGGVRRTPCTVSALEETFASFEKITAGLGVKMSGMMIAELFDIDDSVPRQLLITLRRDRSFGPVVIAGIGGTGTEVWGSALRPGKSLFMSTAGDITGAKVLPPGLADTFFYPVVTGGTRITRSPMVAPEALTSFLKKMAMLGSVFSGRPEEDPVMIEELEINPVQITGEGRLVALDALLKVSTGPAAKPPAPDDCIESMLDPSSVLVIGASAGRNNMGRIILGNLLAAGKLGKEDIFVIHPDADEIDGCRAFRSPADIPGGADMTVFTIPASESSVSLLEELISGGYTRSIVLISGGFGETES
ncbi:MAG TPA: acetate--CoA ligase family protein, partial [Candidatus Krumholzibacterium sp.]|nr:acetate--CoA ligase family protein [Candidatus Krumholzibacterium sp.]